MRRGTQPGLSGITVKDLLTWNKQAPEAWSLVLKLVNLAFQYGILPDAFVQGILVLIPKTEPDKFRGITLLDVVYKLCSKIIHLRLQDKIEFHPDLHGFRPGRGTDTAILEAKLLMQLSGLYCQPLYQIFLDLSKAYDSLD
jgi:hypothetical protein